MKVNEIIFKLMVVLLIQAFLISDFAWCINDTLFLYSQNTLSPKLTIDTLQLQQVFVFYDKNATVTISESAKSKQQFFAEKKPAELTQRILVKIKEFCKGKQAEFYLFVLLHTDNEYLQKILCQALLNLADEKVFRLLRSYALSDKGTAKIRKRAEKAIIEIDHLDPKISESLGIRKILFKQALSLSNNEQAEAMRILDRLEIRSERGLDNIVKWIKSGNLFLIAKALHHIKKIGEIGGKGRLEKLRAKGVIERLIDIPRNKTIPEQIFTGIIEGLSFLGCSEEEIMRICIDCLKDQTNFPKTRRKAVVIMGNVKENKEEALNYLIKFGFPEKNDVIRYATIEAMGMLGDLRALSYLEDLLRRIPQETKYGVDKWGADIFVKNEEYFLVEEAIAKLENKITYFEIIKIDGNKFVPELIEQAI